MPRSYLIVVDMQEDFVYGPLGSKEAKAIVPAIIDKVKNFDGEVIFTRDSHKENYLDTQEGRFLPVEHCISYSDGWEIIEPLDEIRRKGNWNTYSKNTFGCVNLAIDLRMEDVKQKIEAIEIVGVCTDVCVVSNALLLKAYMPEVPVTVDSGCCAGITPQKHEAALETMRSCQIIVK